MKYFVELLVGLEHPVITAEIEANKSISSEDCHEEIKKALAGICLKTILKQEINASLAKLEINKDVIIKLYAVNDDEEHTCTLIKEWNS